jgi:hypothetical protein
MDWSIHGHRGGSQSRASGLVEAVPLRNRANEVWRGIASMCDGSFLSIVLKKQITILHNDLGIKSNSQVALKPAIVDQVMGGI